MHRKRSLIHVRLLAIGILSIFGSLGCSDAQRADVARARESRTRHRLSIPPLMTPETGPDGEKIFHLTARSGETWFYRDQPTETWGYNGSYLGPTLRATRSDRVHVRVTNDLPTATTVHWHGMSLPGSMDGGPHQTIPSGETWEAKWRIDQPAATLWYHPHVHRRTSEQVYRGLAGLFIIDEPRRNPLPFEYGVNDLPIIVQDRRFDDARKLVMKRGFGNVVGPLGDEIVVNGTRLPFSEVVHTLVRLRILNASNSRVYRFHFDDDRKFSVIASDSGLLRSPVLVRSLQLSPGERAEIVVEFEAGETTMLQSSDPDLGMGFPMERLNGGSDRFNVLEFRAAVDLTPVSPLPSNLVTIERIDPSQAEIERSFVLGEFAEINGQGMDMTRIDVSVRLGSTEIWSIENASDTFHNFHIHLVHFQVLEVNGSPPSGHEAGWKDTVQVPPGSTVRLIARFDKVGTHDAPFMFHCHMLAHEDAGMMGQFTVMP